jgi:O-antigen/teichoic acid export membrane protein/glycosyltransferase involved in cell wall biosynthesis
MKRVPQWRIRQDAVNRNGVKQDGVEPISPIGPRPHALSDVAVIVPTRNAAALLEDCLASIMASKPAEVIVVDGMSTDGTLAVAGRHGVRVISDLGAGLPAARQMGAQATACDTVVLVDADVVLSDGALEALVEEMREGNYVALQAGLASTGGPGYWGRALAMHHRTGRSRNWFGLVATAFRRDKLMEYGFDDVFSSGEDVDIRWRLAGAGERIGVSTDIVVAHRFAGDDFAYARDQWRMDGYGLGQMVRQHGLRGLWLLLLPAAAAVRGIGLSLLRLQPEWVLYYLAYALFNYLAMANALVPERLRTAGALVENALGLIASKGAAMLLGLLFWLLAAHATSTDAVGLAAASVSAMMLCTQLSILGVGAAFITHAARQERPIGEVLDASVTLVVAMSLAVAAGGLAVLRLLPAFEEVLSPGFAALFILLAVLGTLGILFDHVAVALDRGRSVALRGALAGGLPVIPLLVPRLTDGASAAVLVGLWLPGLLASAISGWLLLRRELADHRHRLPSGDRALMGALLRSGAPNWALTLSDRVPGLVLPLVVTQLMSPAENAHWYVVWMAAWAVYAIPNSVGIALFAEIAQRPAQAAVTSRRALRLALGIGLVGATVVALLGPFLLSLLGTDYRIAGVPPLMVLLVGVLPLAVVQVRYAACRAADRVWPAVLVGMVTATGGIVLAATVGVRYGLVGVASSWLVALTVAAPVSSLLVRQKRPAEMTADAPVPAVAEEEEPRAPLEMRVPTSARASLLLVTVGVGLWVAGARSVDLTAMSDYGVASVLTPRMWVALGLLGLAMMVALLQRRPPGWVLAVNVVALCFCVFGLSSLLSDVPRSAITFRHVGVTNALISAGMVDRSVDAYFDWPGFFAGLATVTKAAGLSSPLALARWAPLAVNLMCLPPLLILFRALTSDRRKVWLAVWFCCALNWINQDYLSPQSFDFILYLSVLALLVTLFRPTVTGHPDRGRPAAALLVLLLCAALVPAHQLTPFALLTVVSALVLFRQCTLLFLPFILLTAIVAWDGYVALPYISGHAQELFGSVGDVKSAADANIASRVAGSPDHLTIVHIRLAITLVVWFLAGLVSLWQLWRRRFDLTVLLLAWSPLLLIPTQPYGGEMLLRVFWFSLPGVSLLLATAALPAPRPERQTIGILRPVDVPRGARVLTSARWSLLTVLTVGLLITSFVARYGNERMDQFSQAEMDGTNALYRLVPPNALIIAGSGSFPWRSQGYVEHKVTEVNRMWTPGDLPATTLALLHRMRAEPNGAALVITRSQMEASDMLGLLPTGSLQQLTARLDDSPSFRAVYHNSDVYIWQACGSKDAPC